MGVLAGRWNAWVDADARHRIGRIRLSPGKCRRCNGLRVDIRRGGTICTHCMGRGRTEREFTARYAAEPADGEPAG